MPDIIIHDGPAPQNPLFVGRAALPQIIGGLQPGQYRVINTSASPEVTVYDPITALPLFSTTLDQMVEVSGFAPGSDPISFTIDSGPYAGEIVHTVSAGDLETGPVCLVPPRLTGTPEDGQVLTGTPGLWFSFSAGSPVGAFLRDGAVIEGAGGGGEFDFHTVETDTDGGATIQYRESLTDAAGSRSAVSAGLEVAAPVAPGLEVGLTNLGPQAPSQAAATERSMSVNLGAADPDKQIVLVLAMDGSMTSTTVRIEAGGVEYPLTLVQTASAGGMRLRIFEGAVPAGGTGLLKFTQGVSFERITVAHLFARKSVTRRSTSQVALTATAGTPITATVNVAANDQAIYGVIAQPGAGDFTGTTFGTEILDVPVGSPSSPHRLYVGLGRATAANAAQPLSVTPPTSGSAAYVTAVYGA